MTKEERICLAQARLSCLNGQMVVARANGDADRVQQLDAEIAATEARIAELESNP
jgi:hypothetical protein